MKYEKIYKPGKGMIVLFLIFLSFPLGISIMCFIYDAFESHMYLPMSFIILMFIIGIINLKYISKIVITNNTVEFIDLLERKSIKISDIKKVYSNEGPICIQLNNGKSHKMPMWFDNKSGIQKVINNRKKDNKINPEGLSTAPDF